MINDLKNPQFRKGKSKSYVFNIVKTAMASIGAGGDAILSLFSGLLASALILYSGYVLYDTFYVQNNAYSAWDVLREYKPDLSGLDDGLVPGETWETMQEIVKDYRSWITVYDTTIDYPVVQGEDDLYYARNDIYGNPSLTGAIYLAADNAGDFSENYSLIYGHHMDNGAMFGALDKYAENEYFQNHREGILITRDKIYDFKFFATLNTDAYDDKIYIVGGDKNLKELLAYIKENAVLYDEAAAKGTTKILALSTCVSALTNGRLVVFANLKERKTGDERIYIEPTIIEDNPRDAGPADGGYTYYDVLFFKDLGDTDVYAYERVRSDSKAVPPDAPEKEGYTFAYWGDEHGNRFDFDSRVMADSDLYAYYDINQYNVRYYNEDGSSVLFTRQVDYNNFAENIEIPAKDGYYAFDFTKPIKDETKLYVVYKPVSEIDYTVKYYDENGKLIEQKTVGADQGFKAEDLDITAIYGYDSYWSATPGGEPFDMNTVLDGDISLYIVYKPIQYTVTYYNEDGSEVVDTITVNFGNKTEKLEIPEKDGYYAYWSTTPDGNTEFDFTKPVDGEVDLYIVYKAIPEEDYTVSYYDENGKLIEEKTVGIEEGFKAENLIIPERKGYYAYWSTSPDGDPFDMNTVLDGDISLYIVYKPVNDKGTQGGSGSTSGGNGSGTSGGDGGDGGEGGENNPDDGGESTNPFEELINYFKPTGTSYNANGRPAWALVNLISMIITIYILFPIMHMKAKYGRGNLMKRINKQKKDLWEANALFEREEDVREGIRKQALENRKKENEDADKALVIPPITEEEFDEAVEDLYYKVKKFLIRFRTGITMETIVSVVAVITFLLTEDIRLPMVLIDRWTPLMLLFLLGCWLTDVILARYRRNTEAIEDNLTPKQDENSGENAESETKTH